MVSWIATRSNPQLVYPKHKIILYLKIIFLQNKITFSLSGVSSAFISGGFT